MAQPRSMIRGAVLLLFCSIAGACGGGGSGRAGAPPTTATAPTPTTPATVVSTTPYQASAAYAGTLRTCTYAGSATRSCTLDTLPFLGMQAGSPSIADVGTRTLVSHRWMGDNLARVLAELPPDVLPLFRSITAVVIASDVRPAYYDPQTGAIYLDPAFLWLTPAERDTVSDAPDPRSDFGRDLAFHMPWRYVRDSQPLTVFINADGSRDLDQIVTIVGYLLYHELAHAADFMPPSRLPALTGAQTVSSAIAQQPPLSSAFSSAYPLTSATLKQLAAVSFLGSTSTAQQRSLQPEDLVEDFASDGATQYYAYTSRFEDFATLFETAMMKWHFGYDKDTAIAHWPAASDDLDDSLLAWGERGRLGGQPVLSRALAAGQQVYPGDLASFEAFLLSQPAPLPMTPGTTWGENLTLPGSVTPQSARLQDIGRQVRQPDDFLQRVFIR